jgi:predicted RNase H-like HicB family nuclease
MRVLMDRQTVAPGQKGLTGRAGQPHESAKESKTMHTFNVVVERDPETRLYVGYVPGWPGAHSQGTSLDELHRNLQEVLEMLLEDGEPKLESEFVGIQTIHVG